MTWFSYSKSDNPALPDEDIGFLEAADLQDALEVLGPMANVYSLPPRFVPEFGEVEE